MSEYLVCSSGGILVLQYWLDNRFICLNIKNTIYTFKHILRNYRSKLVFIGDNPAMAIIEFLKVIEYKCYIMII